MPTDIALKEHLMTKVEALRFIAEHYGHEGMESNTFNSLLFDTTSDLQNYSMDEILTMLKKDK